MNKYMSSFKSRQNLSTRSQNIKSVCYSGFDRRTTGWKAGRFTPGCRSGGGAFPVGNQDTTCVADATRYLWDCEDQNLKD